MPTVSTRRAEVTDAATVARFVHALVEELSGGKNLGIESATRTAETVLADVNAVAVIACEGDEPVGVIVLNQCTAIYAGGKFGVITELYIRPDMRSRGIAPHLIAVALAEGRERGWKRLEVGAPAQPKWNRTLGFYLRNGFEEIGPRLRRML
jgi:GNAT superfamily N-acetyltransferase